MFIWNIVHMKFIWTIFFVNIHLSLLDQYVKYFFMVPHLCTFVGYEFSIMLADILFWSALEPLREDMVNLNTLRSCRYVHLYFFRVYALLFHGLEEFVR